MSKEFSQKEVSQAIGNLKNLELPQGDLCKKCVPFRECSFRSALVATGNLNGHTTQYFNDLVKNSENFKETCSFSGLIAESTAHTA